LRKRDVLSIVEIPIRSNIIMRLDEAGKAAYSDLLDSTGVIEVLDSRGNFNYHLNFLLENSIVVKEGMIYRLTDKGRAIAQFVKEVNQTWNQIEPKLGGGYVSIVGYAEEFEKETGIKMQKKAAEKKLFGIAEIIMDESLVLGIIPQKDCKGKYFDEFEEIKVEDLELCTKEWEWEGKAVRRQIFCHPKLSYGISPFYLGAVMRYVEHFFNRTVQLSVMKQKEPSPILVKAQTLGDIYDGPAFFIAPTLFHVTGGKG